MADAGGLAPVSAMPSDESLSTEELRLVDYIQGRSDPILNNKTIIDPEGDVLFVCGSIYDKHTIQVSSKALSLASKVFKTLFSRRFKEGTELANKYIKPLVL
jgi:hypothetical protein